VANWTYTWVAAARLDATIYIVTTEALYKLHAARPFVPFFLRLGDGQRLPVEHPEMLAYAPKSRVATVFFRDGSFELVDLLLVTGLEVRVNGSKARRR
jgi:hypothetical protein